MDPAFIVALVVLVLFTAWNVRRLRRRTEESPWESLARMRGGPLRYWSEKELKRQVERGGKDLAP